MKMPTFYVNGTEYTLPCSMEREITKRQSENSGYLMDNTFHNDIIAVYAKYTVKIAVPIGKESEYANLHDLLTMPQGEYEFVMPYNQKMIAFKGMVNSLPDKYYSKYVDNGGNDVTIWREISFVIESTEPIKGEVG